jgi:glutamate formiminotransferase/formiminotetrahydrofolate cyclodeaminase
VCKSFGDGSFFKSFLNVRINAGSCTDKSFVDEVISKGKEIERNAAQLETDILKIVNETIGE